MRAMNIEWDTDGEDISELDLPDEAEIPDDISEDEIGDWLSDEYGYCHYGYDLCK